jgi:diguanylate cyclase (GGDEF)-like protein
VNRGLNSPNVARWSFADWLVDPSETLPHETRAALMRSLFGMPPLYVAGLLHAVGIAAVIAFRLQTQLFMIWAAVEIALISLRIPIFFVCRRALAVGTTCPLRTHVVLALLASASLGFGTFLSVLSGDWVVATIACLSSAFTAGIVCLRNFAAPRLVVPMVGLLLGPCAVAALLSGEPIMLFLGAQIPFYIGAMGATSFRLNALLVKSLLADHEDERRSRHDVLTGVLNRSGLARDIAHRIDATPGQSLALFYLDLDGFKVINDSFGHQVGDELLKSVAERLRSAIGPDHSVARLSGDEFVVVAPARSTADTLAFGQSLVQTVGEMGYIIGSEAAIIGVSAGVALYPDHGRDLGALLAEADTALYQAKFWGRAKCVIAGNSSAARLTPSAPSVAASAPRWDADAA